MTSEFLSLVENSEPPEGSALGTLRTTHGVANPTCVLEEMQGLVSDLHAKKIPKDQLGALVDGLKWTISEGTIKAVTGVHVRLTRVGPTMVADITCVDPEGVAFMLKELPLILARGPPLWRYWLSLPAGDRLRHLLKRWAPDGMWTIRPRSHGCWGNTVTTTPRARLVTPSTPKLHAGCSPTSLPTEHGPKG